MSRYKKEDYQIGIICALHIEAAAMTAMLNESHVSLPPPKDDPNEYTFGRIGEQNVIITCLAAGDTGTTSATTVANNMLRSFSIKFGLMVGIGGGAPSSRADIRLGDIVVSYPTGIHGGVVQWDFGKTLADGKFQRTGQLSKPPKVLLHALQSLKIYDETEGIDIQKVLSTTIDVKPQMAKKYMYQGQGEDQLFQSSYNHVGGETCKDCVAAQLVQRNAREEIAPTVFYGNIASGNQVMRDGVTRDRIARDEEVICFEMEAAGLMENFPCLVIRGICDYADTHKNKIWQRYAAATAAAFARVFLGFVKKQEVIDAVVQQKFTILPFQQNTDFVPREDIFQRLDQLLPSSTNYHTVAIWGLGGSGKTQVALEYAYRWQVKTSGSIFWVRGDTEASFSRHYSDIARKAGLSVDLKGEELLGAVKQWMEKLPNWLLIVDNVDDLKIFKGINVDQQPSRDRLPNLELLQFIPKSPGGIVIWTSRDRHILDKIVGRNRGVEVEAMTMQQSLRLFQTQSGYSVTNEPSKTEKQLLELLERLPLAIVQAGAFIRTTGVSLSKYISMLDDPDHAKSSILEEEFDDPGRDNVPNSIMKTWLITMKQIEGENDCAMKILNTIAFLDNQGLPFSIIQAAAGSIFGEAKVLLAAGRLIDYSFLQKTGNAEDQDYQEHRLVQIATRRALSATEAPLFSGKALKVMENLFPSGEYETWESCRRYLPHALKAIAWKNANGYIDKAPKILSRVGWYYWEQGRSDEAEQLESQALNLRKSVLGEKHPDTITAMANLASTWRQQGRYNEAEQLELQVLELQKTVLGEKHPHTIIAMANLASTWHQQGRYDEDEPLKVQVLELQKSVLGEKHPDTISAMANLASTWHQQGRYDEAEQLDVQVLDLYKSVLGEKHPNTIRAMANLASTWHQQGRYDGAEQLDVQVLDLRKSVLGEKHPDTISAMANLAGTWQRQGRSDEAEQLKVQVLDLYKSVLGEKHPNTIRAMANLASTWHQQGRYDEAEQLEVQVLDLRKSVLGEKHPSTIRAMANLASTWHQQGRYDEAEQLKVQVLDLRKSVLGEKHPGTIRAMANLASTWHQQGRYDEAEQLKVQVLDLRKSVLGEKHPDTISAMANLAGTWQRQGRSDEAEQLKVQVLDLYKSVLGEKHPDTITAMANLASTWHQQGRYDEAKQLEVQLLDLQKSLLREKQPDTLQVPKQVTVMRQESTVQPPSSLSLPIRARRKGFISKFRDRFRK